jgi:hypothetical protein
MERILELDRFEHLLQNKVVPNYFTEIHRFTPQEALSLIAERMKLVDTVFKMCFALKLQRGTGFAAVRLFDRYLSTLNSKLDIIQGTLAIFMVACVDIMGKTVDIDNPLCGHSSATYLYYHYSYPYVENRTSESKETFSTYFSQVENKILTELSSEVLSPTPVEYLGECCPWFSSTNAAASPPVVSRKSETDNADTFIFLCDAFIHSYDSTKYTCKEISAAASFIVTENERAMTRKVPVLIGSETTTPQLIDFWASVPWIKGKDLIKKIKWCGSRIFKYSDGMKRVHALRFQKEASIV